MTISLLEKGEHEKLGKEKIRERVSILPGTHMRTLGTPTWIEGKQPLQPPFDKKKVRQAITMAVNKEELLKRA